MNHVRIFCLILAAAILAPAAWAQPADPPAAPPAAGTETEADLEFRGLRATFSTLYESLQNGGGVGEKEQPVLEAFLVRVRAFTERWPDHAGGVAMALQLSMWLDEEEQVSALFGRLTRLRPGDTTIALAWLRRQETAEDVDPERIEAAYRELIVRFPDNAEIRIGWAERLVAGARYEKAIETLVEGDFDPAVEPKAVALLADCYFAEHRFAEALATLESISDETLTSNFKFAPVKREKDRNLPYYREYIELWPQELEIRAAEESAGDLPLVEVITPRGRILVELLENEAPNTVANFVSLSESGFYAGTTFHRFEPNFMIQGGDPNSRAGNEGTPGLGDPGYLIADEHTAENHRNHFRDSVAMAKSSRPDSAGCQFYFNHRPTPWLNSRHTVFGRVVDGMEVARSLRADDEIISITVLRKREHPYEPVTIPKNPPPPPAGATDDPSGTTP